MSKWILRATAAAILAGGLACEDKKSSSPVSPAAKPSGNPSGGNGSPPPAPGPPPVPKRGS